MKFGLFHTQQVPRPWDEGSEHRVFKETLDEIDFADRLGFDSMGMVEHHSLEDAMISDARGRATSSMADIEIWRGHGR